MLHFKPTGTSQIVRATVTETEGGAAVETAVVEFELSINGEAVGGVNWPLTGAHQGQGIYAALVPEEVELEPGKSVLLTITVDDGAGRKRVSRVSGSVERA